MTIYSRQHPAGFSRNKAIAWNTFFVIFFILPALVFYFLDYQLPMVFYLAIPFAIFFISSPRESFFLLIITNFIYAPYYLTHFAIHPWDIATLMFLAATGLSWLLRYRTQIDRTPFDFQLWALILATIISGLFAHQPGLSAVPIVRIIIIYLTFRGFYYLSKRYSLESMIKVFIYTFTAFSIYNDIVFFSMGGNWRVFGVSGIAFETFAMVGVPMTLALAIWSLTRRDRAIFSLFFLINLLAALATFSRGPLLTIMIALPVLIIASWLKARTIGAQRALKYIKNLTYFAIPSLAIIILASGLFLYLGERLSELAEGITTGTIMLRYSLWKAAVEGFLLDPLTGIGIGNFRVIDSLLPNLKFDPVRYYLVGMSFHNVFLQYLCETGLFGATAIVFLGWRTFSTGRKVYRDTDKRQNIPTAMIAFICAFIFFITIFYMRVWTWGQEGYVLAFILAILARQHKRNLDTKSDKS